MGYTLTIGEAEIEYDEDVARIRAQGMKLDDAPADGTPTDYTNSRWPSYSAWADFCRAVGLTDMMFSTRKTEAVGNLKSTASTTSR